MFNKLLKLPSGHQALLLAAVIIILVALFYRHDEYPQMYARVGAGVGRLRGSVNLEAFEQQDGPTMALFYAPWCGHCKKIMPVWDELASSGPKQCKYEKINCDENTELAAKHNVGSYPTIKFLPNGLGDPSTAVDFNEERSLDALTGFVRSNVSGVPDVMPDQAANADGSVPPSSPDGYGVPTTSYVGRNFDMS
jgi:thiol-disulfide isomerase/thioredoxin